MSKNYLKVRHQYHCPKCNQNTLEVVVSGFLRKRKEQFFTEKIIGYYCQNCNYKSKANLTNG